MKTQKKPRKRPEPKPVKASKKSTTYQKALEVEREALKSSRTHWDQR